MVRPPDDTTQLPTPMLGARERILNILHSKGYKEPYGNPIPGMIEIRKSGSTHSKMLAVIISEQSSLGVEMGEYFNFFLCVCFPNFPQMNSTSFL